jgi:hypothetical protein
MKTHITLFFQPPITSSPCGPNFLLSNLLQTLSVYVPPLMSETKFRIHAEPQAKLIVSYILIFMFVDSRREDEGSRLNGSKH